MSGFIERLGLTRIRSNTTLQSEYDRAAHSWQNGIEHLGFDAAYQDLIRAASPLTATTALDVGCGSGAFAEALQTVAGPTDNLTLLDISPRMLAIAQQRLPHAQSHQGGIGDAGWDSKQFDIVLCAHVIEHLPEPERALVWLKDRLSPGGTLVLSVSRPHWCTSLVRWRWGHASYKPKEMLDMLRRAGFDQPKHQHFKSGPPSRVSCGYIATR